jgi:DNA-directed RNA polymerase specialized sigma24 family protein
MTSLTVDTADQDTLDTNGVGESLNEVFIAAVLLTGSADRAERAVVEGIETLAGDDVSEHMVLQATIRAAFKQEMMSDEEGPRQPQRAVSWLPIQLQRVLLLPRDLRHAFVLRLLLGLTRDECSRLLQLDNGKLDEYVAQAATFLAQRKSFTDRSQWAQHSTL